MAKFPKAHLKYRVERTPNLINEVTEIWVSNKNGDRLMGVFQCHPVQAMVKMMEKLPTGTGEWTVDKIIRYKPMEDKNG